jgi:site-specific DNA-methyltransferase (adenine-specific)
LYLFSANKIKIHPFQPDRIHPTQKPVALYDWIYKNYAKQEFKVIDTHLGSGSNLIAADKFGIAEFVGVELDKDYFEAMKKRFDTYKSQISMDFTATIREQPEQTYIALEAI